MIQLQRADTTGLAWAQATVTEQHYLHAPVDARCAPLAYLLQHSQAARPIGCVIFGRPEATHCYNGVLTYGCQADVVSGCAHQLNLILVRQRATLYSGAYTPSLTSALFNLGPNIIQKTE